MKMLFLIDGDNNITTGLNGIQNLTEEDTVLVFHSQGMALSKIRARAATSRANISFIESVKDGKNSVDFQIVAELGVRIGRGDVQFAYIISQDQGYVPSVTMLKRNYGNLFCEIGLASSIEECLNITFLLRNRTRLELYASLCKEYGPAKGDLVFHHLKELFEMPEQDTVPAASEPAEKPAEAKEAETVKIDETPAEQPAKEEIQPSENASEEEAEMQDVTAETEPAEEAAEESVTEAVEETEAVKEAAEAEPAAEVLSEEKKEEAQTEPVKAESAPVFVVETPKIVVISSGAVIPGGAASSAKKTAPAETEPKETNEVKTAEPEKEEAEPIKEEPAPVKEEKPAVKAAPKQKAAKTAAKAEKKKPAAKEEKPDEVPADAAPVTNEPEPEKKKPSRRKKKPSEAAPAEQVVSAEAEKPAEPDVTNEEQKDENTSKPSVESATEEKPAAPVQESDGQPRNHLMKLYADPFEKILAGKKTVEVRCNDTKRQKLRVGDTITFEKQSQEGGQLTVRVTSLNIYPTFEELLAANDMNALGADPDATAETLLKKLFRIYGKRQVQTYGAVAIGIELIP